MLPGWLALLCALAYLLALFAVAHMADRRARLWFSGRLRPAIFSLALAVYCTSWTFLGSVGLASRAGFDFLPIYIGPILLFAFGWPLLARVVQIARAQNITSVADFLAARYGKSERVAAVVTLIAVIGVIPYIALQLKAISASLEIIVFSERGYLPSLGNLAVLGDLSLLVAFALAVFAIAFGTRHVDATEHQDGLVAAIAMESVVKLLCFLTVGVFVVFVLFDGIGSLAEAARQTPRAAAAFSNWPDLGVWLPTTLLAAFAALLLPRQFHMAVVENRDPGDLRRAAWLFPAYLLLINLFVVPIAAAGLINLPDGSVDRDLTVLALPLQAGAAGIVLVAFIGALSAATAMVIVETVALAIMVSNDLVVPALIRNARERRVAEGSAEPSGRDMVGVLLRVRRIAIIFIIFLAYFYYRASSEAALATIGLLSFAAIAQLGPAFFAGLFWRRANARGAVAGLVGGFAVWFYTLLLPTLASWSNVLAEVLAFGPFGLAFLRPDALLSGPLPPLIQGVSMSLLANCFGLIVFSFSRRGNAIEDLQADIFIRAMPRPPGPSFRFFRDTVSVGELAATVGRYLGIERTEDAFAHFAKERGVAYRSDDAADPHLLAHAEFLLASAIGAASSRLVLSLMLRRRMVSREAALKLLDDTSAAIQYSRDQLQHALDHASQGVTVFDQDLRLVCWNRAFVDLFDLPSDLVRFGVDLNEIIAFNAARGAYGEGPPAEMLATRMQSFIHDTQPRRVRLETSGRVIETRANHLPTGGIVTTYTDVSEAVAAERALEAANESLEQRVNARTEELTLVNAELARAKLEAEEANLSKTRFLAAASHDILQPLNAARLYAAAIEESGSIGADGALAGNVVRALDAVEEILGALLEMSRLDSGKLKPEIGTVSVAELFRQLEIEFRPIAQARGLKLTFIESSLAIRSDRRLIRRALQNLIANALKYTERGRVLVGCRRAGEKVRIIVADTGPGIPPTKQKTIFKEFQRLDHGAEAPRGLGLGLSIVDRIVRRLNHKLDLVSSEGRGATFAIIASRVFALVPAVQTPSVERTASPAHSLAGLRVLVIDNEPDILKGMSRLLEAWGCLVHTAADRQSAEAGLRQSEPAPDLLLVDYHLDEGDGIETIKALRWRLDRSLPAALVTAERSPAVRAAARAADIQVLNKPVKPAALRALLARYRLARADAAE